MDKNLSVYYQKVANELRNLGVNVEVFPDAKNMKQQYAVTDAKGIRWGILIGSNEADKKILTLKNLATREQFQDLTAKEAAKKILESR